ncbi:MAG: NUDIX hydrolase [Rhodospirillales bacterium]|nr:NUDIX hydrolase [Rhodospirillales bacterium]
MNRLYPEQPLVGVGAVIWRDGQVLLIQRGQPPRQGSWSLPGGLQHLGETVEEAVLREVLEETGLSVRLIGVAAVVDLIDRDDQAKIRHHYTVIDFAAEWAAGEAQAGSDAADLCWADPDDLDRFALTPQAKGVIAKARLQRNG